MLAKPPDPLLVTRSLRDAPAFSRLLRGHNFKVLGCPTIQIIKSPETESLDFLSGFYDWIIFNSRFSVQILFGELKKRGILDYFIKAKKICAVGAETAKVIQNYGFNVDLVPDVYAASGVVESFKKFNISRQQILLTMGDRSDSWLINQLDSLGNQCTPVMVYKNQTPNDLPDNIYSNIVNNRISCLAVTAPSAIHNLLTFPELAGYRETIKSIPVASIGPKTSAACKALGFDIVLESKQHTLINLAESIVANYG